MCRRSIRRCAVRPIARVWLPCARRPDLWGIRVPARARAASHRLPCNGLPSEACTGWPPGRRPSPGQIVPRAEIRCRRGAGLPRRPGTPRLARGRCATRRGVQRNRLARTVAPGHDQRRDPRARARGGGAPGLCRQRFGPRAGDASNADGRRDRSAVRHVLVSHPGAGARINIASEGYTLLLSAPEHREAHEPAILQALLERGVDAVALLGAVEIVADLLPAELAPHPLRDDVGAGKPGRRLRGLRRARRRRAAHRSPRGARASQHRFHRRALR